MRRLLGVVFIFLASPWLSLVAQGKPVDRQWTTVKQLEARRPSFERDTLLVLAYADFVIELLNQEPPDSGLVYVEKAYALAQNRRWQKGLLVSYLSKAKCLNIANRFYEAILVGIKGLKLAEEQQNIYFQGAFHRSLGNNYDMLDNYTEAIPHYEASLNLSKHEPSLRLIRAHSLVELGDAYRFNRKQPERAKQLIEEAITIYRAQEPSILGYAYDYYGQALTDLGLFKAANASFKRSHAYYKAYSQDYLLPELLLHEAELYLAEHHYNQAIAKARDCLATSQEKKSFYGQKGAWQVMYQASSALGQLDSALAYHERFAAFADSLHSSYMNSHFKAVQDFMLQARQETLDQVIIDRQREIENLLLGGLLVLLCFSGYVFWSNRRLRQKNRAIMMAHVQGQAVERQRVAADLHDNLGTTLAALQWSLNSTDKSKLTTAEQTVYATISQQVAQAYNDVRLLSHNLLPAELAKQGLGITLQRLIEKLNRNTTVNFQLLGVDQFTRLDQQTEFELYSICLELLTNIIKHAEATEGSIHFRLSKDTLQMTVADNGKGKASLLTDGRGLANVAARVASLAGTLVTDSAPDKGTQHQITVPIRLPARALSQT